MRTRFGDMLDSFARCFDVSFYIAVGFSLSLMFFFLFRMLEN